VPDFQTSFRWERSLPQSFSREFVAEYLSQDASPPCF
jgi:hypothetical protein